MAHIDTTTFAPSKPGLFSKLADHLRRETEAYIRANSRQAEINALKAKSDAELARMGLERSGIAHYVFSDRIWF